MRFDKVRKAIDAMRRGEMVILVDDEDRENEGDLCMAAECVTPEAINFMATHGRGLICLTLTAERLAELQIPAVTLGRLEGSSSPAVVMDDSAGIADAVRHLAELGHRRIAHVAGPDHLLHSSRRRDAFTEACTVVGLEPTTPIATDFSPQQGAAATERLLDSPTPPTAIVFGNDPMAIAGLGVAPARIRLEDW